MDRFDRRLRAELHQEFDTQVVDTPPLERARYGRLRREARRPMPLRTAALVTTVFAVGVLVGLVYDAQHSLTPLPGRSVGVVPPGSPSAATASRAPSAPPTATPSSRASTRPTGRPRPGPPRTTAPPPAAFSDDFAADPVGPAPPAGWQVDDGQWAGVVDYGGHAVSHDGSEPLAHLSAGSTRWSDYSVSADVTTALLDLGFAGVAGRYQDPGDDYECGIGGVGQLQLWVVQGGSRRLLAAAGASLDLGSTHHVVLQLRGGQLSCSLDGAQTVQANDATFAAGRIALVATAGETAEFADIRVAG